MTTTSIDGKTTKVHIREAIKQVFPGIKFSFTSSFDSVTVAWIDGPLQDDVERVLNRFESYTRVLSVTDYTEPTGYEWYGETYIGARYLNASRGLSSQRKKAIEAYLLETRDLSYIDALKPDRNQAERALIENGLLTGFPPVDRPDLMKDNPPVKDRRKPKGDEQKANNVIPLFKPHVSKQQLKEACTAEQRLKLLFIENMMSGELKIPTPAHVDEIFKTLAEAMVKEGSI